MTSAVFTKEMTVFRSDAFRLNGRSGLIPFIRKASVQWSACFVNSEQGNQLIGRGNDGKTN